jgi:hypothetical protein
MLRSFTVLALSACAVASASAAGTNHDLRAAHAKDSRVFVTLENKGFTFRDLKIGDHNYTLQPKCLLTVKAPVGTIVYSASSFGRYHRGDAIVELTSAVDHSRIDVR